MKTKEAEKVITTLKDRIGHSLKWHFTEIPTSVNNLNRLKNSVASSYCHQRYNYER